MHRAVSSAAAGCVLAGPTALAFFSGGYQTEARLIAALVAWSLVLALALTGPAPLPRGRAGRVALAGLAALTAWTAVSIAWAPLGGPAIEAVERLVLYTGALLVALSVLRAPRTLRAMEPALAAGSLVVIAYGLAGRLLPGIVELDRSRSAGGRLEQPITYWNAEGALAAIGLILCARLAGDHTRPAAIRVAGGAATVPLGAAVYLTYSRGALAVAALGVVLLVALAPTRAQLRASAIALGASVAAGAAMAALPGVASLKGSLQRTDQRRAAGARDPRGADGGGGVRHRPAALARRRPAPLGAVPRARRRGDRAGGGRSGSWRAGSPTAPARPSWRPARARGG